MVKHQQNNVKSFTAQNRSHHIYRDNQIFRHRKKLTWRQDEFRKHIVKKYSDMERGESASETGREHIPSKLFKQAVSLNRQREMLMKLLTKINPMNAKKKAAEIKALLDEYIPVLSR